MTVKRGGLARSKRVRTAKRGDSLSTTPTQYGETSPDYVRQKGDPDFLKSYSEEQISLSGGRSRMIQLANESTRRAAERAGSAEGETADVGAVAFDEVGTTNLPEPSKGPTSAPTTYGKAGSPPSSSGPKKAKVRGSGKRGEKGGLYGRISKATGTTRGEARGIMKRARKQIRAGNKQAAARRISRALAGGKTAGVRRTPARAAAAKAAGQKISNRIAQRQRGSQQGSAGGGGPKPRQKRRK